MIRILVVFGLASVAGAQPNVPAWSLANEVTFGDDSRVESTLTVGRRLIVHADGRVYIAQPADGGLRVFAPNGKYLQTIGRKGHGPGEFQDVHRIGFVSDTLWAADTRAFRVSFFSSAGKFFRSERIVLPGRAPFFTSPPLSLARSGSVISVPSLPSDLSMQGLMTRVPVIRHERNGRVLDTLVWLQYRRSDGVANLAGGASGKLVFSQPFADDPLFAAAQNGEGFVVVDRRSDVAFGTGVMVSRYGPEGQLISKVRVPFPAVELTTHMVDRAVATLVRPDRRNSVNVADVHRALYRPRLVPPVTEVMYARDGSIWLRGPDLGGSTVLYSVLSMSGRLIGSVAVPRGVAVRQADDRFVWVLGTDTDDVPFAARYRIVRPASRP